MELHRHRLMVLGSVDLAGRTWSSEDIPAGPHHDQLLMCGCCEAPLVYGWSPEELTAVVRCECGCCCAASEAGATTLSGGRLSLEYVKT
jgi:hypothetical protein